MTHLKTVKSLEALQKNVLSYLIKNENLLRLFNPPNKNIDDECINYMLLNNKDYNLVLQTHKLIISALIFHGFFKKDKISKEKLKRYFSCFKRGPIDNIPLDVPVEGIIENISRKDIPFILEEFHINYLNSRLLYEDKKIISKKSTINYKDKGSVYTPNIVTKEMISKTLRNVNSKDGFKNIKILDFGCGTGRFYIDAFNYLTKKAKLGKREIIQNNLYGIDIDSLAIDILKTKIYSLLEKSNLNDLDILSKNIINKNMLIEDKTFDRAVLYTKDFKEVMDGGGFDIIISNPPYFLLKINNKEMHDKYLGEYQRYIKERIDREVKYFRDSKTYNYSIEGMLNYYKLAIEMMLKVSRKNAEISIICPSTLFADVSSKKLRKHLILDNKLREIKYFPESTKLFDNITQSTAILYLKKGDKTNKIKIENNSERFYISLELLSRVFGENYEVPYIDKIGWSVLNKISNFKKLKEIKEIRNKRGELDLTLFKDCITKKNTGWRLVRGNMLSKNSLIDKNGEYVLIDKFLRKKSKEYLNNDFKKERLICQQISNMDTKKRLNFVKSNKNDILANSCNYIYSDRIDLEKLKSILNSVLLNWRFKITSSNNHVNNYELNDLPILNLNGKTKFKEDDELENNITICKLYGLTKKETKYILHPFFKDNEIESELHNQ